MYGKGDEHRWRFPAKRPRSCSGQSWHLQLLLHLQARRPGLQTENVASVCQHLSIDLDIASSRPLSEIVSCELYEYRHEHQSNRESTGSVHQVTLAIICRLQILGNNYWSSCDVADALLKLKVPHGGFLADLTMWSPQRQDGPTKIVGPAYTVKYVRKNYENEPRPAGHYVDLTQRACSFAEHADLTNR